MSLFVGSINNSQVAVPGEPGAYGVYKFGINSDEDLICYVSLDYCYLAGSICSTFELTRACATSST